MPVTVSNKRLDKAGEGSLKDDYPLTTGQLLPRRQKGPVAMGACPGQTPMS